MPQCDIAWAIDAVRARGEFCAHSAEKATARRAPYNAPRGPRAA
jgi:hypothetical protein